MLVIAFVIAFAVAFVIFLLVGWVCNYATVVRKKILIIVLGDVGRSPRMEYHALSFAKEGFAVDLVGFDHSPPINELQNESLVTVVPINEPPKKPNWLPQLVYYVLKTIFLFVQLIMVIFWNTSKHSHILVQNPPAIPTLAVAWLIGVYRQSKFIIDWHNYGYTILSLAVGSRNPLVNFSKLYEGVLGRRADVNVCVTRAMRDDLKQRWDVNAITLYDRPPQRFKSVEENERHRIFLKLSKSYDVFKSMKEKVC